MYYVDLVFSNPTLLVLIIAIILSLAAFATNIIMLVGYDRVIKSLREAQRRNLDRILREREEDTEKRRIINQKWLDERKRDS